MTHPAPASHPSATAPLSLPRRADGRRGPVVVLGSLNMDLVMRTQRMPGPGETLHGEQFDTLPGGKGANQAVACARMGAPVVMVGRVGDDAFGSVLRDGLAADGIDVAQVAITPGTASGVALIVVEADGQNRIVLAAGANGALQPESLDAGVRAAIGSASLLVLQLEVPMATVQAAADCAVAAGVPVLLNPAPAAPLPAALLAQVALLVPNESEASELSGIAVRDVATAEAAARRLVAQGAARVLVTLGHQGVLLLEGGVTQHFPAHRVQAVDTTAAGDSFLGGVACGLHGGMPLAEAIGLGQAASALCVTQRGAQVSIPTRAQVEAFRSQTRPA